MDTEMIQDELQIAPVRLEENVEDISCQRNAAEHGIDGDIAEHLHALGRRDAETSCLVDDIEPGQSATRIAIPSPSAG